MTIRDPPILLCYKVLVLPGTMYEEKGIVAFPSGIYPSHENEGAVSAKATFQVAFMARLHLQIFS
jgi:hypothetical protein